MNTPDWNAQAHELYEDWDGTVGDWDDLQRRIAAALAAAYSQGKDSMMPEATMGVGDGRGNLFVHGTYEAIKTLQTKLLAKD